MAAGGQTGTGAFSATTLGARYAETWLLHHTETGIWSLGLSPFQRLQMDALLADLTRRAGREASAGYPNDSAPVLGK